MKHSVTRTELYKGVTSLAHHSPSPKKNSKSHVDKIPQVDLCQGVKAQSQSQLHIVQHQNRCHTTCNKLPKSCLNYCSIVRVLISTLPPQRSPASSSTELTGPNQAEKPPTITQYRTAVPTKHHHSRVKPEPKPYR